jgi:hypothetical protein
MPKKFLTIFIASITLVFSSMALGWPAVLAKNGENSQPLEKIEFIHWKKDFAKGGGGAKAATCYSFLTSTKVKWQTLPVSYKINPVNPQGLTKDFVTTAVSKAAETWDAATSRELMANKYVVDPSAAYGVQNYQNAIVFGNYPTPGVIAVTSVWYNRYTKSIVEFDMMFDTDFSWGNGVSDPSKMDLENIAAHEFGHAVGLGDIYTASCSAVTMYGYSDYGDIQKRTLESADITGLRGLYGI